MLPMNQGVNTEAEAEQHPRPTVASSRQLSAANKRRKNAAPGRFICDLCSQDFTSRHNLKSQSSIAFVFFLFLFNDCLMIFNRSYQFPLPEKTSLLLGRLRE